MAALTKTVKVAVVAAATLPLIGCTGRLLAATDGHAPKLMKAGDMPLYPVSNSQTVADHSTKPEPTAVRIQITNFRKLATGVWEQVSDGYDTVKNTANIGMEHSKATLDFVQTNPGELPRISFISLAAMGGIVIGYKRSVIRKFLYASIAGLSSATLCYPKFTVELSLALREDCRNLWKENIGWPLTDNDDGENTTQASVESSVLKKLSGKVDHGQSKPEDKDMYSTRS